MTNFLKEKGESEEWPGEGRQEDEREKIFQSSKKLLRSPTRKKSETEKDEG